MSNARHLFPLENIEGDTEAGAADRRRIGHVDANEASILEIDLLAHEAVVVGANHRHILNISGFVGIDDGFINARGPDSIDLLTGADQILRFLRALVKGPAGEDRRHDLDVGILLERLSEALVAVGVGGHAVDATQLRDIALAAELLEQSLGSQATVGGLVIGYNIGRGGVNCLVHSDNYDVPVGGLLDHRIKRFAIGRINNDDVDAGRDEIAQIGDLLRWSTVAVGQNDLGYLTRCQGLGLDRADHFLAPTVAD